MSILLAAGTVRTFLFDVASLDSVTTALDSIFGEIKTPAQIRATTGATPSFRVSGTNNIAVYEPGNTADDDGATYYKNASGNVYRITQFSSVFNNPQA